MEEEREREIEVEWWRAWPFMCCPPTAVIQKVGASFLFIRRVRRASNRQPTNRQTDNCNLTCTPRPRLTPYMYLNPNSRLAREALPAYTRSAIINHCKLYKDCLAPTPSSPSLPHFPTSLSSSSTSPDYCFRVLYLSLLRHHLQFNPISSETTSKQPTFKMTGGKSGGKASGSKNSQS
jgi:hypothetical protein